MPVHDERTNLLSWGSDTEEGTLQQALKAARLPFVPFPVALMADGHIGIGATVGSVIPTVDAICPSFVGVDIGCGMIAVLTSLTADDLPDNLNKLMPLIEQRIPAGKGKGHDFSANFNLAEFGDLATSLTQRQEDAARKQLGTLGSGNHFFEVCLDEMGRVWIVLHSGSRGIGNQLAQAHIGRAKGIMDDLKIPLEDKDLAFFVQGTQEFDDYITDMRWAQNWAYASREKMMAAGAKSLFEVAGHGKVLDKINCHHNYTEQETHYGTEMWVTRKGAILAAQGVRGVVPGSMGTASYIVEGLGNPRSYNSSSHGAGRKMSRGQAKRELDLGAFERQMDRQGIVWNSDRATALLDEAPGAYKDIDQVMRDQSDLSKVLHVLHQVFNYKG